MIKYILLVDIMHNVSWPGQFDLQLALMLDKKIHQGPSHCGRGMKEKGRDPQDGSLQLLQAEEEIIPVLNGKQIIVVPLQDAGVKSGQVGLHAHVLGVDLRGGEVAAEDKVSLVDLRATVAACQDAAVSHHSTHTVVLVEDGRCVREQGLEVVTDGEDVFVAGVIKVHQLANTDAVLS